ncbi:conserved hypothetical protein [Alteracholeplasma palmae J233]|uniref:HTH cro/C1-type domain-containing protein n=1 Tax=Alteracholeplasma palmae (strain ATCC 49389 / J233) TaxID=1318466 RepID=U4KLS8_ALTPJ|nr:helix-turn-helix transcriptional regulator [Alteracholeplasma palmae]CCV64882.1 conserved hypothetical protein [Alteracholeplasma palmae J233]
MEYLSYSKELSLFFEKLRILRGFSQESFTSEIISLRQYRRYLSGEYQIPQSVINLLSKRLGLRPEHLILEFESKRIQEANTLNNFHNAIVNKDFKKADEYEKNIIKDNIIDANNLLIYEYSILLRKYYMNLISEPTFIDDVKELISYSTLFNKNAYSSTELIIVSSLLSFSSFKEKDKIITIIKGFLSHKTYLLSGQNEKTLLLCYYRLADYAGLNGNFSEVITLCNEAINYGKQVKSNYLLADFFYYKALAYHFLDDPSHTNDSLLKLFYTLKIEDNNKKITYYSDLIKNYFNDDLITLVSKIDK